MADSKTFVRLLTIERRLTFSDSDLAVEPWWISQMQAQADLRKPDHNYGDGLHGPVDVTTYLTQEEWHVLQSAVEQVCRMIEERIAGNIGQGKEVFRLIPGGLIRRVDPITDFFGRR